jgi:DNA-binding MarR family transcriptional regulator
MTKSDGGDNGSGGYDKYVARNVGWFRKVGYSEKSAAAIVDIDAAMTRIRRGMLKREVVNAILAELDPNLDLNRLDVMSTVMHWHPDGTQPDQEVTVGTVAERLGIDPSRASRLVADVIDLGYLRRAASQADSRRIVLEPTEQGLAFGEKFRLKKAAMLARSLKGWSEPELVEFARLLERYSHWGVDGLKAIAAEPDKAES